MIAKCPSANLESCLSGTGSFFRTANRSCLSTSPAPTLKAAGLEDGVDYHWENLLKTAALSTLLGVGAELGSNGNQSDLVRALQRGSQDSINQSGQQLVRRQINVRPTLTIRPGFPVRVLVNRDLVLAQYQG
jgi:type IV secretory pathway VirB10-like protein